MKRLLIGIAIVAVLAVAVALLRRERPAAADTPLPTVVRTERVTRGALTETIALQGTLRAAERVDLAAAMPSTVTRVLVAEGDAVPAGAVLIELDAAEIAAGLERATAGVAAARALLAKARLGGATTAAAAERQIEQAAAGRDAADAAVGQARAGERITSGTTAAEVARAGEGINAAAADQVRAERALAIERQQAEADVATAGAGVDAAMAELERARAGARLSSETAAADLERARAGLRAAEASLRRAKAGARPEELATARAQVEQARIGRDKRAREVADLERLHADGGVSGLALDNARTELAIAEQQLAAAQAQLDQAVAGPTADELDAAEAQVEQARAGVTAAEAAARRSELSAAEVAAAEAQLRRARSGLSSAEETRDERVAIAEQQVAAARAQVRLAEAGLAAAQAGEGQRELRAAERRAAQANLRGAEAALGEAELARRQADLTRYDVAAAEAGLREALAQQRLAADQLRRARVTTPVAGVVARLEVSLGDSVLPGVPVAVVATTAAAELSALCTAAQRERLAVGQEALVRPLGGDDELPATVSEVAEVAEEDGRSFRVRLLVAGDGLSPGLHAAARVVVAERRDVLLLPLDALQGDDDERYVFVRRGDQAARVPVTIGLTGAERAEVLDGLTDGEEVVIAGAAGLVEGAPIEVVPAPAE